MGKNWGRSLAVASGIGLLCAAVAVGASAQAPKPEVVPPIRINPDSSESRWHGMPGVAVDPNNPRHIMVSERHQAGSGGYGEVQCMSHTSYDAGATWTHVEIPIPSTCGRYDTRERVAVAAGSDSAAYFFADGAKGYFFKSPDGGMTFEPVVEADPEGGNFGRIVADVRPGEPDRIYVARHYNRPPAISVPFVNLSVPTSGVVASTDGGQTFGPRVHVSEPDTSIRPEGTRLAIGPNGSVYAIYLVVLPAEAGDIRFARSTDQGKSWERLGSADKSLTPAPTAELDNWWPEIAADKQSGAVYVIWADERNGDADLWMRRSLDGGKTWADRQRISHDAVGNGRHQYRGAISVAPNGRIDLMYYDAINTCPGSSDNLPCYDTNVYLRTSTDQGATFGEPLQLNARPFDYRNKRTNWTSFDKRDVASAIASSPEVGYPVWTDTSLGNRSNTNRDIFATRAQYAPFVRVIPPPRFKIVATPPPPIPEAPPPPPPPPPPPSPILPAQPIVPPQPPPLLSGAGSAQAIAPIVAPGPAPVVQPEPRIQEATAVSRGQGSADVLVYGVGVTASMVLIAFFLTLVARPQRRPRPVPNAALSPSPSAPIRRHP